MISFCLKFFAIIIAVGMITQAIEANDCLKNIEQQLTPLDRDETISPLGKKISDTLLGDFPTGVPPWKSIQANSEQTSALYLGPSPREIEIEGLSAQTPQIPTQLKTLGEKQAQIIRKVLGHREVEFEAWPTEVNGDRTWVFARWRSRSNEPWRWSDKDTIETAFQNQSVPPPILPTRINPNNPKDYRTLFEDFMENTEDLYSKPSFSEGVVIDSTGEMLFARWVSPEKKLELQQLLENKKNNPVPLHFLSLPQPARFNKDPITFIIRSSKGTTKFPSAIQWTKEITTPSQVYNQHGSQVSFKPDDQLRSDYQNDVKILTGEADAVFPISKKKMRFTRKNSASPDNQLMDMIEYLEERYQEMGLKTTRQEFNWRGIAQANLIVKIPGKKQGKDNRPIVIADHIDTAFAEEIFHHTGKRVSVPGADDNVTAVAGLLQAAEHLKYSNPEHDIWLVHLTGEEFPADDLGARHFISEMLRQKQDLGGVVIMDMIGFRKGQEQNFQISVGAGQESLNIGHLAKKIAEQTSKKFKPIIRTRYDEKSYLYNTDGLIFSDNGFPVILLNEVLNKHQNLTRKGYHDMTDTSANIDWEYATNILKVAIKTSSHLANTK